MLLNCMRADYKPNFNLIIHILHEKCYTVLMFHSFRETMKCDLKKKKSKNF